MTNIFEEMEADAQGPGEHSLNEIARMAEELEHVTAERQKKEQELKEVQERERQIAERDLPEALEEVGMESFTLSDGTRISVREDVKMSIPKNPDKRERVFSFLREQGLGSLIKQEVTTDENTEEAINALRQAGIEPKVEENAHTGAVKSALKELEAEGEDIPWQEIGGYKLKQARINK